MLLCLTISFSGEMYYKLLPSNVQDPPILQTYRQRYDLVLIPLATKSSISRKSFRTNQLSSNCPMEWAINDNPRRYPRMIPYAKCNGCDKIFCKPVKFSHKVLYSKCDNKTGEMAWEWVDVAYVYLKKLS